MGVTGGSALLQGLVQVGGEGGESGDGFVQVAVGGGEADLVVGSESMDRGGIAEPAQHQQCLPVGGQRTCAAAGASPVSLGAQHCADIEGQLACHVERGTMGDHVGPLEF